MFTVPVFTGEAVEGDKWMEKVISKFKSNAVSDFLSDRDTCERNMEWSSAFASRLRESVSDNPSLGYLSTELEEVDYCCNVWDKIKSRLSSSDLTMARSLALWTGLFALKCETIDDFLVFHSEVKKKIQRLKNQASTAIQDDIFVKAFMAKAIVAPELQIESKKFLMESKKSYAEILQDVYNEFRAFDTSEMIRSGDTIPARRDARRAASEKPPSDKSTKGAFVDLTGGGPRYPKLPSNTGNKIPVIYYQQFKFWFDIMKKPKDKRTAKEVESIDNFVWKSAPNSDGYHQKFWWWKRARE